MAESSYITASSSSGTYATASSSAGLLPPPTAYTSTATHTDTATPISTYTPAPAPATQATAGSTAASSPITAHTHTLPAPTIAEDRVSDCTPSNPTLADNSLDHTREQEGRASRASLMRKVSTSSTSGAAAAANLGTAQSRADQAQTDQHQRSDQPAQTPRSLEPQSNEPQQASAVTSEHGVGVLLSPIADIKSSYNGDRLPDREQEQARRRLAALDTRSMGVMRAEAGSMGLKGGQQRGRAYSDSRPSPTHAPTPIAQTQAVPQAKEQKKGGFSAFLRRLTKRKPAKLAPKDVNVQANYQHQVAPQAVRAETMSKIPSRTVPRPVDPPSNSVVSVSEMGAIPSTLQGGSVGSRKTVTSATTAATSAAAHAAVSVPLLSPAQSIASAHRLATAASNSSQLGVPLSDIDPVNVPLPPSPNIPDDPAASASASPALGVIRPQSAQSSRPSAVRSASASSPTHLTSPAHISGLPRSRSASPRSPPLTIPTATSTSARRTQAQVEDEEEYLETVDEVRPLDSLRIITRARSMSPGQAGPLSAGGSSLAETVLQTPISMAASPPVPVPSLGAAMRSSMAESASASGSGSEGEGKERITRAREQKEKEKEQGLLQVSDDERDSSQERERYMQPNRAKGQREGEEETEEMRDEMLDDVVDYLDTPMYAGSSPPRKAPIGSAPPPVSLGRKESKWRRSVMGLSDIRNGSLGRKASSRQPVQVAEEDAFDSLPVRQPRASTLARSGTQSYLQQQQQQQQQQQYQQQYQHQRRQNHRVSCQPTLHSNASIAAQVRGMKDDKEKEAAETMFMM